MMRLTLGLAVLLLTVAACGSRAVEPVTSNEDWEPVTRDFNGFTMVQVPPGCFSMGSDFGRRDELPEHEVCFEQPFWIDQNEITNAQYGSEGPFPGENKPRTNMTWVEARDFCTARGGRLPTEAEWEYTAAGPSDWIYPWGGELDNELLIFDRNSPGNPADVGSRPEGTSWVGANDMAGNVFEWVLSEYEAYPYDVNDGRNDPANDLARRVYRSGIYSYIDYGVANSIRFWLRGYNRDWFIGFRCVVIEEEQ
jgi:formylglycine-generating enzyme required for sulfatase activity